jgi:TP901 family phage tail tape measure protein
LPEIHFITKISDEGVVSKFEDIAEHIKKTAIEAENSKLGESAKEWAIGFAEAGTAAVAMGVATVGAIFEMSEKVAEAGEQIDLLSQRVGIDAETLSKWGYIGAQNGVQMETLARSIQILSRNLNDTTGENQKAAAALSSLGIKTHDASGEIKSADTIMREFADKIKDMPNGMEKTALAMAVFGRGGAALIPVLNGGSEEIDKLGKKAEELGIVFDGPGAKAAHEFADAQKDVNFALEGLEKQIATEVMPEIKEFLEWITKTIVEVKNWAGAHPELIQTILHVAVALIGSGGLMLAIAAVIGVAGIPAVTAAVGILGGAISMTLIPVLIALAYTFRNELGSVILTVGAAITQALGWLLRNFADVAQFLANKGVPGFQTLANNLTGLSSSLTTTSSDFKDMAEQLGHEVEIIPPTTKQVESLAKAHKTAGGESADFKKKVDDLIQSVTAHGEKTQVLVAALGKLNPDLVSHQVIYEKLGKDIKAAVAEYEAEGKILPANAMKWAQIVDQIDAAKKAHEDFNKWLARTVELFNATDKIVEKNTENMGKWAEKVAKDATDAIKGETEIWEKHYNTLIGLMNLEASTGKQAADERIAQIEDILASDTDAHQKQRDLTAATLQIKQEADDHYTRYHKAELDYLNAMNRGASEEELKQIQDRANEEYAIWNTYKGEYVKLQKDADRQAQQSRDESIRAVRDSAGHIFDDMLTKSKNVFSDLNSLLKGGALSIGRTIFEDVTGSLLGPVYDVFKQFFQNTIKGLVDGLLGGIGKSIGGWLGGILGSIGGGGGGIGGGGILNLGTQALGGVGGIAGLAGLGGAGAVSAFGGVGGATLASSGIAMDGTAFGAVGGSGSLMGSLGAFMTNPWTIGIAAGIAGVVALVKLLDPAHKYANQIVKQIENPFWQAWGQILPTDKPAELAALPADQAETIGEQLSTMDQNYLTLVDAFRHKGSKEDLVGKQSLNNTQPHVIEVLQALRTAVTAGGKIPGFEIGTGDNMIATAGPYFLHEGERVIRKTPTNNGGVLQPRFGEPAFAGAGGENHYHFSPVIQALDARSVRESMPEFMKAFLTYVEGDNRGDGQKLRTFVKTGRVR